jgi:predicted house-cleaning noncanonical NTP pyrophosphatase (MazG superfamily)
VQTLCTAAYRGDIRQEAPVPVYDKVVRDGIPERLERLGLHPVVRRLDGPALALGLRAKLDEEAAEFDAATDRESRLGELADVLEVVVALAAAEGADEAELLRRRAAKAAARGAFAEGWLLVSADDD